MVNLFLSFLEQQLLSLAVRVTGGLLFCGFEPCLHRFKVLVGDFGGRVHDEDAWSCVSGGLSSEFLELFPFFVGDAIALGLVRSRARSERELEAPLSLELGLFAHVLVGRLASAVSAAEAHLRLFGLPALAARPRLKEFAEHVVTAHKHQAIRVNEPAMALGLARGGGVVARAILLAPGNVRGGGHEEKQKTTKASGQMAATVP